MTEWYVALALKLRTELAKIQLSRLTGIHRGLFERGISFEVNAM